MHRRSWITGASALALLTTSGGNVRAHLEGYQLIDGYLGHVSSFACGITAKKIPNLDQHPADVRCEATVTEAQVLCENPQNHQLSHAASATRVVFVAQRSIVDSDITDKEKGKASPNVHIQDNAPGSPLLNPQF